MPRESQRALDDAALARRTEEYSDTRKGQDRADADQRAKAVVERFLAGLVARDVQKMVVGSSSPWGDRGELVRDEEVVKAKLAEYLVPRAFAGRNQSIVLLNSLEELEQSLCKRIPDAAREAWTKHLAAGSRIAVAQGGRMILGLSLRKAEATHSVSGLLFDYFPKPQDRLLQAVQKAAENRGR